MLLIFIIAITSIGGEADPTPWTPKEHRMLADSALQTVLADLSAAGSPVIIPGTSGSPLTLGTVIWGRHNFGRLVESLAEDDGAASRFQLAGQTVFEQLGSISEQDLRSFWELVSGQSTGGSQAELAEPASETAVANYLLAHVAALNLARTAGASQSSFFLMLAYEAMAQGFLSDAHAAGHLLVPRHDAFQGFHPVNNDRAHDHYNLAGVFVVNGRHEAWQAFGDGLLTWYASSYRQVLEASATSLRQVLLAYYVSQGAVPDPLAQWIRTIADRPASEVVDEWLVWKDGRAFYDSVAELPSLSFIPMPVSATWSVRTDARNENGIRIRRHYPQFQDDGYHDPDLPNFLRANLYSKAALPPRFVPPALANAEDRLVEADTNRDVASVEFYQVHKVQPTYTGLTTSLGLGMLADDERSAPAVTGQVGYGLLDNIIIATHVAVNIGLTLSFEKNHISPLSAAFGMNPAGLPIRWEIGYATTTDDFLGDSGVLLSGAYDLTAQILGWTYIGLIVRLRYSVMFFDEVLHAPSIEITFH